MLGYNLTLFDNVWSTIAKWLGNNINDVIAYCDLLQIIVWLKLKYGYKC